MKWTNKGHQFDRLGKKYEKRRLYIYGAGNIGEYVYRRLCTYNCIDAFVDRSVEKQKEKLFGIPVISPDIIFEKYNDTHIIIIAIKDKKISKEVERRLLLLGYLQNVDYFFYDDFVPDDSASDYRDNFYFRLYLLYACGEIWLDSIAIYPSTVCNLRCKNCLAFTPNIEEHRIKTLQECKEEVDLFFKWISHVRWFQISGGEPQLWPHLCELIEYIGSTYRDRIGQRFEIVTNGSIIPSNALIGVMKKYDMDMVIDDYGDNYKVANNSLAICDILNKQGIDYIYSIDSQWVDLGFFECDNSGVNLPSYYDECGMPFHANEYGKIYTCSYGSFAIKAGLIPEHESEYFDLSKEINKDEKRILAEFLLGFSEKGYSELCKKCYGWVETINNHYVPAAEQI